ncbi:MAG: hypothetical protein MUF18_13495 [Fimbriiglobus sp.]|nr:hypothetical protein [Fimbriiglobus sp.]
MRHTLSLSVLLLAAAVASAQPKPPALPPNYPTLTTLASLGGKPGGTVDITLTGTNLTDVTQVWTSFGGKATIPEGQKDATKLSAKIEIPANTPLGFHSLRVATRAGVTAARPFIVEELPEVTEKENNKKAAPQAVANPCVVVGTATAEMSDFYKVPVKAGEPVTFEVLARRIGSPCDPVLLLYDAAGKELFGLYADDSPGLQGDCRLTHTFPATGEVIVEVRDTTYRGGADFAYRLRVGYFPGATTAFPLAVETGKSATVGFAGGALDGIKSVAVKGEGEVVYASPKREGGASGWPVPVRVHAHPETVEQEPNNTPDKANALPVPGGVSARFAKKNDVDHFKITAKKGQKLAVTALTFEVNSPAEVYVRVLDAKGAEVAKSNPTQIGTRVEFTAAADGDYVIACEHTNYLFGPNEVYHLSVKPVTADFAVAVAFDRIDVPAGGVGLLPITALTKLNGFSSNVELEFVSSTVSGKVTLPTAANPQPATPLYLPLVAKPGAASGVVVGTLKATAKIDGADVSKTVDLIDVVKGGLANMPTPPREVTTQVAVAVVPAPPFRLELKLDAIEVAKGGTLKGKVIAKRSDPFDAEITLSTVTLPVNVAPKFVPIKKGENEAAVEFSVPAAVAAGPSDFLIRGTAKVNNKEVTAVALPVKVNVTEPKK